MTNFFDLKTRYVGEYVDGVLSKIKRDLDSEENKLATRDLNNMPKSR
jgi:hypothetical protein